MDALRARLEQALASTHLIERELGGGGMSRTYVALERALDRRVVVKVLAPELLAGASVERFRREVLLAAQLQHPHVVPVLSAGEVDDLPWFAMPYVDGDSLRQRLALGPVGIGEAVGILRDVARALAYAHTQGVVHRDIKPDNVLLSGGSATVTDFGIAKAIAAARGATGGFTTNLTVAGTSIGTPVYMAPEQAAGDPDTDHRADLYSFGVMAYEVLAGETPFHGLSPARLLAAQMGERPKDVRALRPDCPDTLAELVRCCLEKEPAARPATATDVLRVLDTVTSSGVTGTAPSILAGGRIRIGMALTIWAVTAALVALTAWAATEVIGLPDWVFPGSLGVMLAGLPVILATWYVQRVVYRAYAATPHLTPGGGTAVGAAQGTMATLAMKASPHLSWRRTWLGGGLAVGSFAALVLTFMVMRSLGVGPFASLRGSGAFGDRETLVVADFRSPAGDSTLGATVAEALRTDLAQSPSLRVLTRANVLETLRLMQRTGRTTVDFDLARQIATREGAKAVLDGSISQLGQSYVISARLVSARDGSELATFRETASNEGRLLDALGSLAHAVRERAGESLRTIRASQDLERVTTSSLPALRKYMEGTIVAEEQGDGDRGLRLLREAVAIDSTFAMAWRKIAVMLVHEGRDWTLVFEAVSNAYRYRDRLSELERLLTEAAYFTFGPHPDEDRALAAYEGVLLLDSLSISALNNSASLYVARGDYARAEELYRRVTQLPRSFSGAFMNLMRAQIRAGNMNGLDSTHASYRSRFPDSEELWEADVLAAWGHGQRDIVDSIGRAVYRAARSNRQAAISSDVVASTTLLAGKPSEALHWAALSSAAEVKARGSASARFYATIDTAISLATLRERPVEARAALDRGLRRIPMSSIPPAERLWWPLSILAYELGDTELARTAADGFEKDLAAQYTDPDATGAVYSSIIAFTEGRYDDAIALVSNAQERHGINRHLAYVMMARAHDLAGRPDSAITWFERFVSTPDPEMVYRPLYLAGSYKRLGELYSAQGAPEKAIPNFERFLALWSDAEPELQPRVREVRNRLEQLRLTQGR